MSDILSNSRKVRVIVAYSGSVASVKIPEICAALIDSGQYEICLLASGNAANHFLFRSKGYNETHWKRFLELNCLSKIIDDSDEWTYWNKIGDPVVHIELRKWADIILLAPASADIISKIAFGVSDSLLLSVIRAWDFQKPCVLCPAMNTVMWDHPVTEMSLSMLKSWGWKVLSPVVKTLVCNEKGNGAMASVSDIVTYLNSVCMSIDRKANILDSNNIVNTLTNRQTEVREKKSSLRKLITSTLLFMSIPILIRHVCNI